MPIEQQAVTEVTAFRWVPPFAVGFVRDLRVRWALEEIARPYKLRLLDALSARPEEYLREQPFGQVPAYRDDEVQLFESGAILIHLGTRDERLLPAEHGPRMRAIAWLIAALNSIEPMVLELGSIDIFHKGEPWTADRRPQVIDFLRKRLGQLSSALGSRDWLEGRFSIADILMVTVLREARESGLVAEFPNLDAYMRRGEARPAFQQALSDQLAVFKEHQPEAA